MADSQTLGGVGSVIVFIGIAMLLLGIGMPATQTHTSETCVDDPIGYGESCVEGQVTTANPMKAPLTWGGVFLLVGGVVIVLLSYSDTPPQSAGQKPRTTDNSASPNTAHRTQDTPEDIPMLPNNSFYLCEECLSYHLSREDAEKHKQKSGHSSFHMVQK